MSRVLVLGGSGFVGRHLCEQLVRAGWQVTVPTRRASQAQAVQHLPGLTVVRADVHDAQALQRLLPGHAAVVNLVAILHGDEAAFERTHVTLPTTLARAMQACGVRRLVQVSALGADPQAGATAPSMYLRSKSRGEAVLQAAAQTGSPASLQLTVLRPSVIFGADDRFLNLFAQLQRHLPVLALGGASARFQPVWVQDVAQALVRCLQQPATVGQTFEACGPQVCTLRELVQLAARLSRGQTRPILNLPEPLARLQAMLMEWLPGPTLMSRDNLDSMRVANVASGTLPGLEALGITPAALSAVAPGYLGHTDRYDTLRGRSLRR